MYFYIDSCSLIRLTVRTKDDYAKNTMLDPAKSANISNQGRQKTLSDLDFLKLVKLDHLTETEKKVRLEKLWRLAFLHFLNLYLPQLLPQPDLLQLEKMTQNIHAIDLQRVAEFLGQKIKNFNQIMNDRLNHIKLEALIHHYETERRFLEHQQKLTGADYLVQILAVERLLRAINLRDWDTVEATVPQTSIS